MLLTGGVGRLTDSRYAMMALSTPALKQFVVTLQATTPARAYAYRSADCIRKTTVDKLLILNHLHPNSEGGHSPLTLPPKP